MKTNIPTLSTQGTTGTLTADVNNPQVVPPAHNHVGDPDKMLMLLVAGDFRVHSTERFGSLPNQFLGLDLIVPQALVPANGVEQTLSVPSQVTALWWAYENFGSQGYRGVSGELKITLTANEHASGTFHFVGQGGTKQVQVTSGKLDLQDFTTEATVRNNAPVAGTGHFNGQFSGGSASPQFAATEVSLEYHAPGPVPAYFEIQGREVQSFPPNETVLSIQLNDSATALSYNLSTSTEVRVSSFDFPGDGFAYATAGTLTFTSLPNTGPAVGTLSCTLQKNDEPPFTFTGNFNVVA